MCLIVLRRFKGIMLTIIIVLFSSPLCIPGHQACNNHFCVMYVVNAMMSRLGSSRIRIVEISDMVRGAGSGVGFLEKGPT